MSNSINSGYQSSPWGNPSRVYVPTSNQGSSHVPPSNQGSPHVPPLSQARAHVPPLSQVSPHVPPLSQASPHVPPLSQASPYVPPLSQATTLSSVSDSRSQKTKLYLIRVSMEQAVHELGKNSWELHKQTVNLHQHLMGEIQTLSQLGVDANPTRLPNIFSIIQDDSQLSLKVSRFQKQVDILRRMQSKLEGEFDQLAKALATHPTLITPTPKGT